MKQTENNQMDLLLRSLAGRGETRSVSNDRAAEDLAPASHLDADELSSYSERALPAATHARYTAHLADCSRCRKIVSELVSASGRSISDQLGAQTAAPAFWDRVRVLLSPSVLRYAVPALALFAVLAIGLVALKQQPPSDLVAQNERTGSDAGLTENKQVEPLITQSESPASPRSQPTPESQTGSGTRAGERAYSEQKNKESKPPSTADSVSIAAEKDASPAKAAGAVAQPTFAPEPAAAPPAPKLQTANAQDKPEQTARREESAERDALARQRQSEQSARNKAQDRDTQVTASEISSAPTAGQRTQGLRALPAKPSDTAKAKKADDKAEMRTVGGRRFRRQGAVWVDTSYHSSTATTTVTRGSEQYRALVADEPGIRTIAEQLGGEVILVWKGRAYRIR